MGQPQYRDEPLDKVEIRRRVSPTSSGNAATGIRKTQRLILLRALVFKQAVRSLRRSGPRGPRVAPLRTREFVPSEPAFAIDSTMFDTLGLGGSLRTTYLSVAISVSLLACTQETAAPAATGGSASESGGSESGVSTKSTSGGATGKGSKKTSAGGSRASTNATSNDSTGEEGGTTSTDSQSKGGTSQSSSKPSGGSQATGGSKSSGSSQSSGGTKANGGAASSSESKGGSTASSTTAPPPTPSCKLPAGHNGNASLTWYTLSQGTATVNCSYPTNVGSESVSYVVNSGKYFAAMNTSEYSTAAACGACVEVTRDGNKTVVVTIADQCPIGSNPKCKAGHIDLAKPAFLTLGSESEGYLGTGNGGMAGSISWKYVACPVTGNVHVLLKEPSNAGWNEFLVANHVYQITKFEAQVADQWVVGTRKEYNYFNVGDRVYFPMKVRITDINGSVVEGTVKSGVGDQDLGVQFPTCK